MKSQDFCSCNIIHEDILLKAKTQLISQEKADAVADLFKVFGDTTRVKILHLLTISEMCVCDISAALDMTQSAISHQLRVLKQAGLVKNRKEGKIVYYSLDDDHVLKVLTQGIDHVNHK